MPGTPESDDLSGGGAAHSVAFHGRYYIYAMILAIRIAATNMSTVEILEQLGGCTVLAMVGAFFVFKPQIAYEWARFPARKG
jgi:hypothetical protein